MKKDWTSRPSEVIYVNSPAARGSELPAMTFNNKFSPLRGRFARRACSPTLRFLASAAAITGCGAAPPDDVPAAGENVETAQSTAALCVSYTSTIQDHVFAGRAFGRDYTFLFFRLAAYYATGSSEYLGSSATQIVTLYPRTGGGYTTNASLCQSATCGNGVIESPSEDCDGTLFPDGSAPQCTQFTSASGPFVSGTVKCGADCKYDLSDCQHAVCGDGIVNGDEECDGSDLGAYSTCQEDTTDGVFTGGQLQCAADCTYDTSSCVTLCGNGVLDPGEDCDGTLRSAEYAGKTCSDFLEPYPTWPFGIQVPYSPGSLTCNDQCRIYLASSCQLAPGCYYYPISGGGQPAFGLTCF